MKVNTTTNSGEILEKSDWEKKFDRLSIFYFILMISGIITWSFLTYKMILEHNKKINLPGFECPSGYHLIPNSYYITDTTGDTLLINHEVTHIYTYQTLTNPQKHAAKILLSK